MTLLGLGLWAGPKASATTATPDQCANVASIGLDVYCDQAATVLITGQDVVPGQTIYYRASLNRGAGQCCVTGGVVRVITPDGVTNVVGLVGNQLICNAGDGVAGSSSGTNFPTVAYTVRTNDMGISHGAFPCGNEPEVSVQAAVTYIGGVNFCNGTCSANAGTDVCNPVRIPILQVVKLAACATGSVCNASLDYSPTASGAQDADTDPKFCFSITLTNTGTAAIIITNVSDTVLGDLTSLSPSGLLPGAGQTVYVPLSPTNLVSDTVNTVTVLGYEAVSCANPQPVSGTANATADVVPSAINCEVRFVQGGQLITTLAGCATHCDADVGVNAGGGPVSVVVRVNNPGGNGQSITNGTITVGSIVKTVLASVAPGAFVDTTITNLPGDSVGCHSYTADVVFNGVDTGSCPPIDTSCSKSLEICGSNCVSIVKLVKCLTSNECVAGVCSSDLSLYSPSATGAKNAGFCYGIIIANCGDFTLSNVVVNDTQLGNALDGFPTELLPGQVVTNIYPHSYPDVLGEVRNTATVNGTNALGSVTASSNAVVTLLNPAIICSKTVSVNGGAPSGGGVISVPPNVSNDLTFAVDVQNNGDVDLVNVQVTDTGTSGCEPSTTTIASLAAGASTNLTLCTITGVVCPPGATLSNIVTVSADVTSAICSIDPSDCSRIHVSSACTNTITLTCETPGCRTTGGGKQLLSENQVCPTDARYVTHGGQVGAPFGAASAPTLSDCSTGAGAGFNNPCIRGEYTHVRHINGGLVGNFHAASNGNVHEFDSLQCACLPCDDFTEFASSAGGCHPADRVYNSPGDLIDGLCNHTDPRSVCGPEPRKAPANKIAFSGVGDYTFTKGKRSPQSVVFRVDLEDRSEPGGAHPKGGKAPPDRYRMRMWFITGDPDSAANLRLREAVAVKDATDERVGTKYQGTFVPGKLCSGGDIPAPDIDDGGDLDRGNRQIHPNTGASCN